MHTSLYLAWWWQTIVWYLPAIIYIKPYDQLQCNTTEAAVNKKGQIMHLINTHNSTQSTIMNTFFLETLYQFLNITHDCMWSIVILIFMCWAWCLDYYYYYSIGRNVWSFISWPQLLCTCSWYNVFSLIHIKYVV